MAMNKATALANLALEARGYVVARERRPEPGGYKVGQKITWIIGSRSQKELNCWVKGPLYVTAETNLEDFQQQQKICGMIPAEGKVGERYFRLVAE
jgi:hypothetical protein